jgi:outer membrane protein assembly factor BamB
MYVRKRNFTLTFIITSLLLAAMLLCAGCAGGSNSPAPAIDSTGGSPPPKVIQGQGEKPVSVPAAFPTEGGVPLNVHLWDGGSYDPDGEIVKWEWNFGDATGGGPAWQDYTDSAGDAWHWYNTPGARIALLRVTDNDGNKDVEHVQVELSEGNNANPVATATADPLSGDEPLTVDFSAAGSYDPDGTIVSYEWDFGAGSGYEDCTGTDGETSHEYAAGGLFTAILRVTDDDGAQSMDSIEIDVNFKPIAVASADPVSGDEPLTVDFGAAGSYDPDGTIAMYEWNFGEGGGFEDFTDTDGATSHEYTTEGTYTAVLRVTDDDGATSAISIEIEVFKSAVDDWRMFGHDQTNSRRSPFTGPATNALKWFCSTETDSTIYSSPAIDTNGTIYLGSFVVYAGSPANKLHAISADGTLKWSFDLAYGTRASTAIGPDGTIYVGAGDQSTDWWGRLHAINPDGTLKWTYTTRYGIAAPPTVDSDGTIYIENWVYLYALNPDGSLKWAFRTGGGSGSCPAIGSDGTVYMGSSNDWLYAINPDGSLKWAYLAGGDISSSPAIGADGTIYVGCDQDFKLHAINPDGTQKWTYATAGNVRSSPAIGSDGTIYVGDNYRYLHAVNPDGTMKWRFWTGGTSSSPAVGGDGTIYQERWNNLYAISPDGALKWSYTPTDWQFSTSPAIGVDGTIYLGAYNRVGWSWGGYSRLYAIGPGEGI